MTLLREVLLYSGFYKFITFCQSGRKESIILSYSDIYNSDLFIHDGVNYGKKQLTGF